MDALKKKMTQLRLEADNAVTRAEDAEEKLKKYDQLLLEKDQEITSMTHKVSVLEAELDKVDGKLAEAKAAQEEGDSLKGANENLTRKVALLEEELDAAEKNVKETMEKLRQVDVKAEHFERQVQRVEQERDQWEKKCEEMQEKFKASQAQLDELVQSMDSL
ncbi:hypothetical protein M405DRAFT_816779 [Rhizopogon salebrosus TDB-379]|nr:hypothetical protein M405DRAFT_816779 [Rhizopogon salebrosus TDB-379]